ncbi:hypothetical protein Tco_0797547 [Tanacetum coccineum]
MIFRFLQLISEGGTPRYLSLVVLLRKVGDEAVHKELGDRMERDIIMSSPKFAETHNVVAFLEKPAESDGFVEIIDFLKASSVKMVNGVRPLQALIDKKKVITKASIRNDLHLDDTEVTEEWVRIPIPPTDSTQIPIIDQPSISSQPKKK